MSKIKNVTKTGGRKATLSHNPGDYALAIGMPPNQKKPIGWNWVKLSDLAQLESGHTPSRKYPEYWGGDIPWIDVKEARINHGKIISDTRQKTNSLGIDNSAARLLPAGTVCLSRGGTVGYVTILGKPMATSQGFANWICGPEILPKFLQYLFMCESRSLHRFSRGTTIKTIYYPEIKAFYVCIPPLEEQKRIVSILDEAFENIEISKSNILEKINSITDAEKSKSNQIFQELENNTPRVEISSICEEIFAGGDVPKDNHSKERTEKYTIPIIGNAVKNHGLYGYTDKARVTKPAITIAGRGSGTGHTEIRNEHFFPIIRLIVLIPNTEKISLKFLKFSIQNLVIASSGSAIPQLTIPMIKQYKLNLPEIKTQKSIETVLEDLSNQSNQFLEISQQKLASLEQLQQSILQEAFTGKLTGGIAV